MVKKVGWWIQHYTNTYVVFWEWLQLHISISKTKFYMPNLIIFGSYVLWILHMYIQSLLRTNF